MSTRLLECMAKRLKRLEDSTSGIDFSGFKPGNSSEEGIPEIEKERVYAVEIFNPAPPSLQANHFSEGANTRHAQNRPHLINRERPSRPAATVSRKRISQYRGVLR